MTLPSKVLKRPLSKLTIKDDNNPGEDKGKADPIMSKLATIQPEGECCLCKKKSTGLTKSEGDQKSAVDDIQTKLNEQETRLREEFQVQLEKEKHALIERFNFILQNEQTRSSCMLREAHRERKEKIAALTQQLECKNMAGLMYVMCAERTKSKIEKMKIIDSYTHYIDMLNGILCDGQNLILSLSRGYKTAARVDREWREKMNAVIGEFQQYICNFSGTPPDQNQYLIDLPSLLKIEASVEEDPDENPIEEESLEIPPPEEWEENKIWWEKLDAADRPFAVFGDMGEFQPKERSAAMRKLRAGKNLTAPLRWKEYMFHDMYKRANCPNADDLNLRQMYLDQMPMNADWECQQRGSSTWDAKATSRRQTAQSVAGTMGSIIKLITAGLNDPVTKANLLGARDSFEIQSTTKLRDKSKSMDVGKKISSRRTSFFDESLIQATQDEQEHEERTANMEVKETASKNALDSESIAAAVTGLSKDATDSLEMVTKHVPDRDSKINIEKTCPVKACQSLHVDSFMRTLPPYMNANPFTHFEQTFEHYETCTPEQLAVLQEHMEAKTKKDREAIPHVEIEPLLEWQGSAQGLATQTPDTHARLDDDGLPPCTCGGADDTPADSTTGAVYRVEDLIPIKQTLDTITKELLWDEDIQFNRFKVLGQPDPEDRVHAIKELNKIKQDFTRDRAREIQKILRAHPSLLDIFQANTRC